MKIWINTGEVSGDLHGARLAKAIKQLAPDTELMGMGGPALRQLEFKNHFKVEDLSVMGITEVARQIPKILRLIKAIGKCLEQERPDALIVVDAPDFHFRLIKAARRLSIPVYYYISPKLWAWREGRAKFIQRHVRRLISILPFEVDFYKKFNMAVDYVGNPLMDEIDIATLDKIAPDPNVIGIMPGSRHKEITSLMPEFARTAAELYQQNPDLRFICAQAPTVSESFLRSFWLPQVPLEIWPPQQRYKAMRLASFLLAASGTAVLESAIIGTPTIICYKVSKFSFMVGKLLLRVPYIGLPNLILRREIFPERLQKQCDAANLYPITEAWAKGEGSGNLPSPSSVRNELVQLRSCLGPPGAADRAAGVILQDLASL